MSSSAHNSKVEGVLKSIANGERLARVDLSDCDLTSIPPEVFQLADCLQELNLGGNKLSSLPDSMIALQKLRILFFAQNNFTSIPTVLGKLSALYMLSFKSNQLQIIEDASLSPSICWLILTDNKISELPSSIGKLLGLRKLMLAGNDISHLNDELRHCQELELVRLAANKLKVSSLPLWFWQLPKLSWLALAGNDCSPEGVDVDGTTPIVEEVAVCNIDWTSLDIMEKLGEGASGVIYKAKWVRTENTKTDSKDDEYVAVKLFKGGKTSDGLPEDEMKASEAAGSHTCSLKVLGRIVNAPSNQIGLVMQLISKEFANLGGPPSFESVTRDTFESGTTFSVQVILSILCGIASVCSHLHKKGITHGDVYAHNILFNIEGEPLLGDFGAASIHSKSLVFTESPSSGGSCNNICAAMERFEVRAFGCLIDDLITRVSGGAVDGSDYSLGNSSESRVIASLRSMHASCLNCEPRERPTFAYMSDCLAALKASMTTY